MRKKIGIAPSPYMVCSWRNAPSINWPSILSELIDNSMDANADHISIVFTGLRDELIVQDNGNGCDDLSRMLAPGRRQNYDSTFSGRYGVGGKYAVIQAGREVEIRSTHQGVTSTVCVDWEALEGSESWEADLEERDARPSERGTRIVVRGLYQNRPGELTALEKRLGLTYAPALQFYGKNIDLKYISARGKPSGCRVVPVTDPELDYEERRTLQFSKGRAAEVRMGIIRDQKQIGREGTWIALEKRMITSHPTRIGITNDNTPGLYCYIRLLERGNTPWTPTHDKTQLRDSERDELDEVIAREFALLIGRAKQTGTQLMIDLENQVFDLLPKAIERDRAKSRKAKRQSPVHPTGAILPSGAGSPHTRAARTQPGTRLPGQPGSPKYLNGLRFFLRSMGESGPVMKMNGNTVLLNEDHPSYAKYKTLSARGINPTEYIAEKVLTFCTAYLVIRGEKNIQSLMPEHLDMRCDQYEDIVNYVLSRYIDARKIHATENTATATA